MTQLRTLFLFGGPGRARIWDEVKRGENADTALRGANYIPGASVLDIAGSIRESVPSWLLIFVPRSLRSLLLLPRLFAYDAIIAQDELMLGYLVSFFSKFRHTKTRWIYVAINSSTLLLRHERHPVRLWFLRQFWKSFSRVICLSRKQIADLARAGVPRDNLLFVPFGIDASFYAASRVSSKENFVLSVGRDQGRDFDTLFAVARRLPDINFMIATSHRLIPEETPRPGNASVVYNISPTALRDLYHRAQVVVVSSKPESSAEGSDCSGQTVIFDALAAGKAVVATQRAWMADYLLSNEDLLVVNPTDPAALASAIQLLFADVGLRMRLAASGHKKVMERYTTRAFADTLERTLNSL